MSQWLSLPRKLRGWAAIASLLFLVTLLTPMAVQAKLDPPVPERILVDGDGDEFYLTWEDDTKDSVQDSKLPVHSDSNQSRLLEEGPASRIQDEAVGGELPMWLITLGFWLCQLGWR